MNYLDFILLGLGAAAGLSAYMSGTGSLYKLFLGLIIGFLTYLVVACQIELINYLPQRNLDGYQKFLSKNSSTLLSALLFLVPIMGIFFMLHPKLNIATKARSLSNLLLGLLLPIFLVGMLSYLAQGSILSSSPMWKKVFSFLSSSGIYNLFQTLPWAIFLILAFLIFYKSLFLLLAAFFGWLWREVILQFFKSWNEENKLRNKQRLGINDEEEHESTDTIQY